MIKKLIYFVVIVFVASTFNFTATASFHKLFSESNPKGKKKCFSRITAYFKYKDGDYKEALRIYRELYELNKNDAKINYQIGKCNVALQNMEEAIQYLIKANKLNARLVDKHSHFFLGQAYQYLGKLDSAIMEYNIYKNSISPRKIINDPVNELLSQTETAQYLLSHPVNIKINNLGKDVNSEFDEGMPLISPGDKTLIFTSRRSDTKGGGIDPNSGQYYDDIYFANWEDGSNKWTPASGLEGDLNTTGHDACIGISPDGNTLFVYKNIPKVTGSGDIYFSTKKTDGKWSIPKAMGKPVNSSFFEGSCSLSPDENTIYFISERNGGYGNADIWKSNKIGKNLWDKPENLGAVINTDGDEMCVFMHSDGKTLYFISNGHNTMGGYDVFKSEMKADSSWSEPQNLGYPINTTKDELTFSLTLDGKKAYLTSNRENGLGGTDIYEIDMSNYIIPSEKDSSIKQVNSNFAIFKGSVIESNSAQQVDAIIVIKELATGKQVYQLFTNDLGDYFVSLESGKEYEISVDKPGFKKYYEKITLPSNKDKSNVLVKLIILEKITQE
ncbi:MAG: tetratricopeptide repeat protein [Bacteroidetes bacterium]|nr:tetratricopeptide repeat protein [Bacteroidota bacterium]